MRLIKRISLILSLSLSSFMTNAQEQERPDRWYEVEVLVFEQRGASSAEELPVNPAEIDTAGTTGLISAAKATGKQDGAYQILPAENYRLRSAFNKLNNSNKYQALYHVAWRQNIPPREQASRIHLNNRSVNGIMTIGISRLLHVATDLTARKTAEDGAATKFRLEGGLRMRSGEVHYIDHPMGGMLVLLTPYTP